MSLTLKIILAIVAIIVIVVGWGIVRSYLLYKKTLVLEAAIPPFSRDIPNAPMKILVLGDSTAVGTGVSDNAQSTAGRLGAMYPQASVTNLAVNGLKIDGLLKILATIPADQRYDLILIQIGANDIIRLTPMSQIQSGIDHILRRAQQFGGKIVLLHSGNIGDSLFFPWFVRPILSYRSHEVRNIYIKEAAEYNASYVDIMSSDISKTIESNPTRYYADDLLHLSGDGYGLWFQEIKKKL